MSLQSREWAPKRLMQEVPQLLKRDGAGGRDQGRGSDRAVSRLPRLWSSAQGTRRSVLVALRLVGPAGPAIDSACVDAKQARPAIRAAVFTWLAPCPCRLTAMFGEIAIVEERMGSNTAGRLDAVVC